MTLQIPNGLNDLPLWLRGPQAQHLAVALRAFFERVLTTCQHANRQWQSARAQGIALDLLAAERSVQRVHGEPEGLYRKRIQAAYASARTAGSKPGLQHTLRLWGLMAVVLERDEHRLGLDIIVVGFSGAWSQDTVFQLLNLHGRACRRYQVGAPPLRAQLPLKTLTSGLAFGRVLNAS